VDRIALLTAAFPKAPTEMDRAVARRILTHPDAERLIGGLIGAFFGSREDVDEDAAVARRDRRPEPLEMATEVAREEDGDDRKKKKKKRDDKKKKRKRSSHPPAAEAQEASEADLRGEEAREESRDEHREGAQTERDLDPVDARDEDADGRDNAHSQDEGDEGMTRLYVNLGRRDGVRAGDIARLLRDTCSLERTDIGRIRVRDKHAFVDVSSERVDHVLSTLPGQTVDEREVVVEVAKS
jgi:ATP-dependent RNA helicase DeaD